jgi:hypothetical protein
MLAASTVSGASLRARKRPAHRLCTLLSAHCGGAPGTGSIRRAAAAAALLVRAVSRDAESFMATLENALVQAEEAAESGQAPDAEAQRNAVRAALPAPLLSLLMTPCLADASRYADGSLGGRNGRQAGRRHGGGDSAVSASSAVSAGSASPATMVTRLAHSAVAALAAVDTLASSSSSSSSSSDPLGSAAAGSAGPLSGGGSSGGAGDVPPLLVADTGCTMRVLVRGECLLAWRVVLAGMAVRRHRRARVALGSFLARDGVAATFLSSLFAVASIAEDELPHPDPRDAARFALPWDLDPLSVLAWARFSWRLLHASMSFAPSLVRYWRHSVLDKETARHVDTVVAERFSPSLTGTELAELESSRAIDEDDELEVKVNIAQREVTATCEKDEAVSHLVIRLPRTYPIQAAEIEIVAGKSSGLREIDQKRAAFAVQCTLRQQGTLAEAIRLWKQNIDKRFEGVDDCMICYSTVHVVTGALPKLRCRTCANTYHADCIYKWFRESGKSNCPMCQNPW